MSVREIAIGGRRPPLLMPKKLLPHQYSDPKLLRVAIRNFAKLPPDHELVIELKAIYPWLGREWQDVWLLYAEGYTLVEIANYWKRIHRKEKPIRDLKNLGSRVVNRLVRRVRWLLSLRESAPLLF